MVNAFGHRLNRNLAHVSLPTNILHEVQVNEIKLAGLPVPSGLNTSTKNIVKESIDEAFVFGFRIVMLICAGLSVVSSVVAGIMVPGRNGGPQKPHRAS